MKLQITNKEIYFAVENCWSNIDYKLKYQINELVKANDADDFEQTVDIDAASFLLIMNAVNMQPQGIAKDINPNMHLKLKNQILAAAVPIMQELAALKDEQEIEDFKLANADILKIANDVQSILTSNQAMLEAKLLNGKTQILS